jgi:hypothetical protein
LARPNLLEIAPSGIEAVLDRTIRRLVTVGEQNKLVPELIYN